MIDPFAVNQMTPAAMPSQAAPTMMPPPGQAGGPSGGGIFSLIPPHVLAQWYQRMMTMPEHAQAQFLNQQLMQIPGLRDQLAGLQSPQNPNVVHERGMPTPSGMGAGPQPNAAAGWVDGLNRGMQKRVEAGKELPGGIQRRQPSTEGAAGPRTRKRAATPDQGLNTGAPPPTGGMQSATPDQNMNTAPRAGQAPMNQYRLNRLSGMGGPRRLGA